MSRPSGSTMRYSSDGPSGGRPRARGTPGRSTSTRSPRTASWSPPRGRAPLRRARRDHHRRGRASRGARTPRRRCGARARTGSPGSRPPARGRGRTARRDGALATGRAGRRRRRARPARPGRRGRPGPACCHIDAMVPGNPSRMHGVEPADVDAELECVGGRHAADPSGEQALFDGPPFLGQVAAPVGGGRPRPARGKPAARVGGDQLGAAPAPREGDAPGARAPPARPGAGRSRRAPRAGAPAPASRRGGFHSANSRSPRGEPSSSIARPSGPR